MKKSLNSIVFYQSMIIFNLNFCIFNLAISSQYYQDIFTREIYEQDEMLSQLKFKIDNETITEDQTNNKLVEHFLHKKENLLARRCLARIEEQIKALRNIHNQAEKREFWENTLESVRKGFSLIGGICGNLIPIIGETLGRSVAEALFLPFGLLSKANIYNHFSLEPASSINKEIRDLETEIHNLKTRMETEPIRELEIAYVKQKRKMQDGKLIEEIEENLIEARRSSYLTGTITRFIKLALNLPVENKILFDGLSGNQLRRTIDKKFKLEPFFESFDETIKNSLLDIVTQTVIDSQTMNLPHNILRKTYYFWGVPSSGKTEASIKIAEFLGLPYFQMTIRSITDLAQENLEGTERIFQSDKVGALIRPLIEPLEKKSFKNGFLILNDLHTILSKNSPEVATAALAFLLDYLDPKKVKFYSPYFNTYIDISRLNIIITSNEKIEENILYQALESRIFQFIEFPKFSDEKIKKILDLDLKQLSIKHKIPNGFSFTYLDPMKLKIESEHTITQADNIPLNFLVFVPSLLKINTLNSTYYTFSNGIPENKKETVTLRFLKSRMENSINIFMRELTQKSIIWLQESKRVYRQDREDSLRLCKMASIADHEEAHFILGEEYKKNQLIDEALISYEQAARSGHAAAAECMGRIFWSQNRRELAEMWIKEAILLGSVLCIDWFIDICERSENKNNARKHLLDLLPKHPNNLRIAKSLCMVCKDSIYPYYLMIKEPIDLNIKNLLSEKRPLEMGKQLFHLAHVGFDNKIYLSSLDDKGMWQERREINNGWETKQAIQTVIFNSKYFLAHIGTNKKIYLSYSYDGINWKKPCFVNEDWSTENPIHLTVFNDKLYLTHVGSDNQIFLSSSTNGEDWENFWEPNKSWKTKHSVSLAVFKDFLYMAHVGLNSKIYLSSSQDGHKWSNSRDLEAIFKLFCYETKIKWKTSSAIDLTSFNNKLFITHIGEFPYKDCILVSSSYDGNNWDKVYQPRKDWRTTISPKFGIFDNKLYLTHVGKKPYEGNIFLISSFDGNNWGDAHKFNADWKTNSSINLY